MNVDVVLNPTKDLSMFAPEIYLAILGVLVLGVALFAKRKQPLAAPIVAALGLIGGLPVAASLWGQGTTTILMGSYAVDDFAVFFKLLAMATGVLVVFISTSYMRRVVEEYGEFFALLVWAVLGLCLMAGASDLIVILLAIEMVSIISYIMTGFFRDQPRSAEASLKYFLFGAAASAVMIYGMSLLYGVAGTTKLYGVFGGSEQLAAGLTGNSLLQPLAALFILVGLGFKIAMAPFHWWAPDAYEGAPTPVTAFLSVGPKAAGLAVVARLFMTGDNAIYSQWPLVVAFLATLTMFMGNWSALHQSNIKRMLAYSSVAHAGYLLIAVVAWQGADWHSTGADGAIGTHGGMRAVMFYLAAYLFMNIGAFAVAIAVEQATGSEAIERFSGLATRSPFLALAMTIFMLSLAGIPPMAGFVGKFYVFSIAIHNKAFLWLAIVGVINSVIAVYYYMNVVRVMYFRPASDLDTEDVAPKAVAGVQSAIIIALIGTLLLGILPNPLIRFLSESIFPGGLS